MQNHSITLPEFFQNGMLFQRDKEIRIFGQALPDAVITASFHAAVSGSCPPSDSSDSSALQADALRSGKATADAAGHFLLTMPPLPAAEHLSLTVSVKDSEDTPICLSDISFGDIWLAGGQSNMEFFLKYDQDFEAVQKLPRNPKIHMYNVPQRAFAGHNSHNKTGYGYWFCDDDTSVSTFSAPAYSFAREIQASTDVPIGIIGCNWGGSTAAAWVPESALQQEPLSVYLKEYEEAANAMPAKLQKEASLAAWAFEDSDQHRQDFEPLMYGMDREAQLVYMKEHAADPVVPMGPYNFNRPGGLYHHMLSTLIPFSIKGVLWYQGETDADTKADIYDQLMTALINDWRSEWNDDFPFLMVQLAPFGEWLSCSSKNYAILRQKQALVAHTVPGVFLAGIMDLGSYYDIHPKQKMEVGRRLSLLARGHVYGESLLCDAPEAVSAMLYRDGSIHISFRNADGLCQGDGPSDFLLLSDAQAGHARKPAAVQLAGTEVILSFAAPRITASQNLTISLADQDYAEIHLQNRSGLTALPFRLPVTKKQALNPFLPSYEYIPDGEPHVFDDRVYLYGSHDYFRGYVYCMGDYTCWSAPVTDLSDWRCEGVIYRKEQDPRNKDGKMMLFAPDAVKGTDGRYYLYYIPNASPVVSVAVCDIPAGHYEFYGFVHYSNGELLGEREGDDPQFDPGVFREGSRTFLYTGFCMPDDTVRKGATVTVLAEDMLTIIEEPRAIAPGLCRAKGTSFEDHAFFEAPSLRKREDLYYFIYSSVYNHELCYATGKSPLGPFTCQGVIVDNCDVGIDSYKPADRKAALHCNNHGSFTAIGDRWYMFYHRSTNGTQFSRQACAEEIAFTENGLIPQVEMTSCGLNGGPLSCGIYYDAYIACSLFNIREELQDKEEYRPMISQDGNDSDEFPGYVCNMTDGATAGFKYFNCKNVTRIDIRARGYMDGCFEVRISPDGEVLASVPVTECNGWETFSAPCTIPDGIHAIYITHNGGRVPTLGGFLLHGDRS